MHKDKKLMEYDKNVTKQKKTKFQWHGWHCLLLQDLSQNIIVVLVLPRHYCAHYFGQKAAAGACKSMDKNNSAIIYHCCLPF